MGSSWRRSNVMSCDYFDLGSPLARRLHLLRCPKCRAAREAEKGLRRGIEHLRAEPAPAAGLARTLAALGATPAAPARRLNSRKRAAVRRWLMPAGAVTAFAGLSIGGWLIYIDRDPGIRVPMPKMPSNNAFDMFRRAHLAEQSSKDVDQAGTGQAHKVKITQRVTIIGSGSLPPGVSVSAVSVGTDKAKAVQKTVTNEVMKLYTPAEKAALVRRNAEALRLLRQGFRLNYCSPPVRSSSTILNYFSEDRSLARLLALEAEVREREGDIAGAVNSRLDAMELGAQIMRGSIIIGRQVGNACMAIGRKPLWDQVDRLNAEQALLAAHRMQYIVRLRPSFADMMHEEEWSGIANIKEIFREPQWRLNMRGIFGYSTKGDLDIPGWLGYFALLRYSKSDILRNYMTFVENMASEDRFG